MVIIGKDIGARIARKAIDSGERLGRHRWIIERTTSWLTGYRRPSPRYERKKGNHLAFLGSVAALCRYERLLGPAVREMVQAGSEQP